MQPDDSPLIEQTPQEFADEPEQPFERKLHGERADTEPGDDARDEDGRGEPARPTVPAPVAADGTPGGESAKPGE